MTEKLAIIGGSRGDAAVLASRIARRLDPRVVIISEKEDLMPRHSQLAIALAVGAAVGLAHFDESVFKTMPDHRPEKSKSKRTGAAQIKRAAKKRKRAK